MVEVESHLPDDELLTSNALSQDDYASFSKVNSRLLNTPTPLKNVPLRIYVPSSPSSDANDAAAGSFKVVQTLVPPRLPNRKPPYLMHAALV